MHASPFLLGVVLVEDQSVLELTKTYGRRTHSHIRGRGHNENRIIVRDANGKFPICCHDVAFFRHDFQAFVVFVKAKSRGLGDNGLGDANNKLLGADRHA